MKTSPFYRDVYYAGKISYNKFAFHILRQQWRWRKYKRIVRRGPTWLRPYSEFVIYPAYTGLMRKAYDRKKLK